VQGDEGSPVAGDGAERVVGQRRQRNGGDPRLVRWRIEAEEEASHLRGPAQPGEEVADDLLDGGPRGVHEGVGRCQVEAGVGAAADRHSVGGQDEHGPAVAVQLDADAHPFDADGGNRVGGGQLEDHRFGAAFLAAEAGPEGELRQGARRAAAEVRFQEIGDGLDPVGPTAECRLDRRHDPQGAGRPGLAPQAEAELGVARGDRDGVAGGGDGGARDQGRELGEPRRPAGGVGEHAAEPRGDGADALGRQLVDGEGRHAAGWP
jgi:hypothetical protein